MKVLVPMASKDPSISDEYFGIEIHEDYLLGIEGLVSAVWYPQWWKCIYVITDFEPEGTLGVIWSSPSFHKWKKWGQKK